MLPESTVKSKVASISVKKFPVTLKVIGLNILKFLLDITACPIFTEEQD